MTLAQHSCPRNMMVHNSQLPFFHIHFWKHKENEHHRTGSLGVYYAITKWNYCLQGADIIV